MPPQRFILRKPDLDTVYTAFLLGCREEDEVLLVPGEAPPEPLADPKVFCIECGGSGQIEKGNFDHHNTPVSLPPACLQALHWREPDDPLLWDWAEYVAAVDVGKDPGRPGPGWSLSQLFSGLRWCRRAPLDQFWAGLQLCRTILAHRLAPGQPLPLLPEWEDYRQAKTRLAQELADFLPQAVFFTTRGGLAAGYLAAPVPGVHGLLRRCGCQISIAQGLPGSDGPIVTIASRGLNLRPLLAILQELEPGWGGPAHGTIIAAPTTGSALTPAHLLNVVQEYL